MLTPHLVAAMLAVSVMVLESGHASDQNYPNRPIRVVTSPPGGGSDFSARLIARGIAPGLGQPVVVENRNDMMTGSTVAKALPDGHTMLITGSIFFLAPLMRKMPYDPVRDFSPITLVGVQPTILVVHPGLPVNSVKELIAYAKARPDALNFASAGPASSGHLAGELFKTMAGISMVHVPYNGNGPAITNLIGGQVQLMFIAAGAVMPHVKSGKLKALGIGTVKPSALAPGLPTLTASGLPGYASTGTITGAWAPANTPTAIINRLNQEIVRMLRTDEAREQFSNIAVEVVGSSPAEFGATFQADMALWGKVIKDAGVHE